MAFPRGPLRAPAPPRVRVDVFAVGRRVYIARARDGAVNVTLMDEAGKRPVASLGDGTEVGILAWHPGWSGNTRYRVRATDSTVEGWVPVGNLRGTQVAIAPAPAAPPASTVPAMALQPGEPGRRKFGQRSDY